MNFELYIWKWIAEFFKISIMSKKKNQKGGRIETVPEHLRKFVESIVIREDLDDPKERARRALEKKRKQKEEEEAKLRAANKRQEINEEDIKLLVKQFKMDFPSGFSNNILPTFIKTLSCLHRKC